MKIGVSWCVLGMVSVSLKSSKRTCVGLVTAQGLEGDAWAAGELVSNYILAQIHLAVVY